ncbi:MAG: hypothetical protein M0T77_00980 [Actinomycetota bacterium]|nr:hypothetical protein [Actinomycetota bacterium]
MRARHVIERKLTRFQVPARETLLDLLLTFEQPVHRSVEIIVGRIVHAELFAERAGVKQTGARELRAWGEHPPEDHRETQIPLTRRCTIKQPREPQPRSSL